MSAAARADDARGLHAPDGTPKPAAAVAAGALAPADVPGPGLGEVLLTPFRLTVLAGLAALVAGVAALVLRRHSGTDGPSRSSASTMR